VNRFEVSKRLWGPEDPAEAPFDLVVGNAFARIEFLQARVDLSKENEAFNRVIN